MNRNLTLITVLFIVLFIGVSYIYVLDNPVEINIQATIGNTTTTTAPVTTTTTAPVLKKKLGFYQNIINLNR